MTVTRYTAPLVHVAHQLMTSVNSSLLISVGWQLHEWSKEVLVSIRRQVGDKSPPSNTAALEQGAPAASRGLPDLLDALSLMPSGSQRMSAARDEVDLLCHDRFIAVLADGGLGLIATHIVLSVRVYY